ncbi:Major Facilitator Superfamily protein [Actinomadura madurae]|uniref:Major Facilitator Superfamily protein n=1 Tax=Actinomadura madurae TaxID=1993 RepID=A0A1I4X7M8_9ACTN|nr:Major Facilitator Superfamily protein [Actinomadura madurae]
MVNGYLLTFAGFMLPGDRAADLFGHRRTLVAGLLLFSAASLAGGLATAPEVLVAARVAQGTGAALLAPATLAVVNTAFTHPRASTGVRRVVRRGRGRRDGRRGRGRRPHRRPVVAVGLPDQRADRRGADHGWASAPVAGPATAGLALLAGALRAGLGQTPAAVTFMVVARFTAALLPRTGVRRPPPPRM